jgi:predicted transposase/invertase (TIGR01784 family)
MNRNQHNAMLEAMKIDKSNFHKYQKLYKYAYILSDGVFKIVFAEEKNHSLLISLVNAMLDLHGNDAIKEITLEMQEFPGIFNKKNCIVDIVGTTNANEKIIVEIQQQGDKFFRDRVEYYIARVIENLVHKSEKYELPRIYFLGLLDFEMFPEEPTEYIHHVDEMCHGRKFFPKIQKIFVEIEKFFELENAGVIVNDHSDAAEWLRAIKSIIKEEPMPERILENKTFHRLLESVKLINFAEELFNLEVKNMTDLQAKYEVGYSEGKEQGFSAGREVGFSEGKDAGFAEGKQTGFAEGKQTGFAEGKQTGFAEGKQTGFAEGKQTGYAEGKEEGFTAGKELGLFEGRNVGYAEGCKEESAKFELEKSKIAKSLLENGVPINVIAKCSGLSEEEIQNL